MEERCRKPPFDTVSLNLIVDSRTLLAGLQVDQNIFYWIYSSNLLLIDVITLVLALKR
jgi:hypothetical protein